jgi:hypothetical protein
MYAFCCVLWLHLLVVVRVGVDAKLQTRDEHRLQASQALHDVCRSDEDASAEG